MAVYKDLQAYARTGNAGGLVVVLSDTSLLRAGQSVAGTKGIRKSTDNGQTWTLKHTWSTQTWDARLNFVDSRSYIYFGTISTGTSGKLVRSIDNGETFTEVATSEGSGWWYMCEDSSGNLYANEYSIGNQDASELYAYNIWKSTDSGATWTKFYTAAQQSTPGAKDGTRHTHHITYTPDGKLLAGWGDTPVFSGLAGKAYLLNSNGTLGTLVDTTGNGFAARAVAPDGSLLLGGDSSPIKVYKYNTASQTVSTVLDVSGTFGAYYSTAILAMVTGNFGVVYALTNGTSTQPSVVLASGDSGATWQALIYCSDFVGASFLTKGNGQIYVGRPQSNGTNYISIPDLTLREVTIPRVAVR
jgi:hypothetical protein